jgi:hypothetical protein
MKKLILLLAAIVAPALGWASVGMPNLGMPPVPQNHAEFSSFSKTTTLEWGCPVADHITASSQAEALQKVRTECVEQAHQAAASKPEVMDVIQTKVVWPDVHVLELSDGYHLSGTFFLETTVVQRMAAEVH